MGQKSRNGKCKPRNTTLVFDMGKPTKIDKIVFKEDNRLKVLSAGGEVLPICSYLTTSYPRENKHPKVINRFSVSPENLTIDPNLILTHYFRVLAVDTNKPEEKIPNVFFTGTVLSEVKLHNKGLIIDIYHQSVIEFHNLTSPSECFGLSYVCKSLDNIPQGAKIAIIIDHNLNKIPLFNSREESIMDDYYLPPGFELLYASTDPGDKVIANRLLKICDKISREAARLVVSKSSQDLPPLVEAQPEDPFTHFRVWYPSAEKVAPITGNPGNRTCPAVPRKRL
jgi:hypothetical protein